MGGSVGGERWEVGDGRWEVRSEKVALLQPITLHGANHLRTQTSFPNSLENDLGMKFDDSTHTRQDSPPTHEKLQAGG